MSKLNVLDSNLSVRAAPDLGLQGRGVKDAYLSQTGPNNVMKMDDYAKLTQTTGGLNAEKHIEGQKRLIGKKKKKVTDMA